MRKRPWTFAALVILATLALAGPASAVPTEIGKWNFDETGSGTTAWDSALTPNAENGTVGPDVTMNVIGVGSSTGYQFPVAEVGPNPDRLVNMGDPAALDPGTQVVHVLVQLKTTNGDGNVVQKGQALDTGGFWKLELNAGRPNCVFKDDAGVQVTKQHTTLVDDDVAHNVTCHRTATGVSIEVDGSTLSNTGATGNISNAKPFVVGGKASCNGTTVDCDYYEGWIGKVIYSTGT
jgi:Laminin G domain